MIADKKITSTFTTEPVSCFRHNFATPKGCRLGDVALYIFSGPCYAGIVYIIPHSSQCNRHSAESQSKMQRKINYNG